MKISIDTAQDSKEEIRKAIKLLQALVEHDASEGSRNLFDSPSADLFGNAASESSSESSSEQSPTNAFSNLFDESSSSEQSTPEPEEKKKDSPQVELY